MNPAKNDSTARFDRAALARQIELLVARLHPTITLERRRDQRVAVPMLFRLTPLDADGQPIESEALTVVGKNISRRGMSFYHDRPLPYRRALITVAHPAVDDFAAEIDVTWCRFAKLGWYESGGRLLAAVTPRPSERKLPLEVASAAALGQSPSRVRSDLIA